MKPPYPSEITAFEPPTSPSEFAMIFRGGGGGYGYFLEPHILKSYYFYWPLDIQLVLWDCVPEHLLSLPVAVFVLQKQNDTLFSQFELIEKK